MKYENLPETHPVRQFCERWAIVDPLIQEDLIALAKDLVARTIQRLVTDDKEATHEDVRAPE